MGEEEKLFGGWAGVVEERKQLEVGVWGEGNQFEVGI